MACLPGPLPVEIKNALPNQRNRRFPSLYTLFPPQADILLGGAVQHLTFIIKPGAVAGAVPAFFVRVPGQLAAQVGAAGGHQVQCCLLYTSRCV